MSARKLSGLGDLFLRNRRCGSNVRNAIQMRGRFLASDYHLLAKTSSCNRLDALARCGSSTAQNRHKQCQPSRRMQDRCIVLRRTPILLCCILSSDYFKVDNNGGLRIVNLSGSHKCNMQKSQLDMRRNTMGPNVWSNKKGLPGTFATLFKQF